MVVSKILVRLCLLLLSLVALLSLTGCMSLGILNPKGWVTYQERKLFFDTLALMLIVVLPVIIMSFTFVYHYQTSHRITDYKPNWSHSYFLEALWWGIPCVIIFVLAVLTWKKTQELDPYRTISAFDQQNKGLIVQVIALPWKWLFIYPSYGIATINYLVIPVAQQVEYVMTADNVPMSAFFIPQLGSQLYVMAGMRGRLHLIANVIGDYEGLNTNYNGDGFSDMHFQVHVVDEIQMQQWVDQIKISPTKLDEGTYNGLLNPSVGDEPKFYSGAPANLFDNVINVYMNSTGTKHPRLDVTKNLFSM